MGRRIDWLRAWVADLTVRGLGVTAVGLSAFAWGALAVWRAKDQDPGLAALGQVGFYCFGSLACLLWTATCLAFTNWVWPKNRAAPPPPMGPAEVTVEPPALACRLPVGDVPPVLLADPAPRQRSTRVGDRVRDTRDGHATYRPIKDPDSAIDPPGTPEEWIDGVTARLNAYHDDAKHLSCKDSTTWNEWVLFTPEFTRFVLKNMAIPRQNEMTTLIGKQASRGFGVGSPEAAKRAFNATATLIASWFPLTRYDLARTLDESPSAPGEDWDERPVLQSTLSLVHAKMEAGQALLARLPKRETFEGQDDMWKSFKAAWVTDCGMWDLSVHAALGEDDLVRHYVTPHIPYKPGENVYSVVERKTLALSNAWRDLLARLDRLGGP